MKNTRNGFTLVEIMIVVGIIATISAIALPNLLRAKQKSAEKTCRANRQALLFEEIAFIQRNNRPSVSIEELRGSSERLYNTVRCPQAGVYFWVDPPADDPNLFHTVIGCSRHGIDTTVEENEQFYQRVVYHTDFEGDKEWQTVRGSWDIGGGTARNARRGENRVFTGSEKWEDYIVTTKAKLNQGPGYGIYFRSTDPKRVDGYILQIDPGYGRGKILFREIRNGRERSPFARANPPKGFDWNAEHQVEIKVEGDTFTAYIDGKEVLQASDDTYKNGMVGLRTWGKTKAEFTEMEVREK